MWQSVKVSNVFNTLTLKQIFWKRRTFSKKTGVPLFSPLTLFPFKTSLLEANVKTNRMATTKWTYHKEWSFASNYFIFLENLFQVSNLLKRVNLMNQRPKCQYSYFSWVLEFNFRVFFSLWAFLNWQFSFFGPNWPKKVFLV